VNFTLKKIRQSITRRGLVWCAPLNQYSTNPGYRAVNVIDRTHGVSTLSKFRDDFIVHVVADFDSCARVSFQCSSFNVGICTLKIRQITQLVLLELSLSKFLLNNSDVFLCFLLIAVASWGDSTST